MAERKPARYWMIEKNFQKELKSAISKLGHFPSENELIRLRLSSIVNSSRKYYEGLTKIKEKMGYQINERKPAGYWQNKKNILKEARRIMRKNKLKKFPSNPILRKLGYPRLSEGIRHCYGSLHNFRKILGEENPRVKSNTWKDLNYTLNQAAKAVKSLGYSELPSCRVMAENGYHNVTRAITIYHGGFPIFREKLEQYLGRPADTKKLESMLEGYAGGSDE